MKNRDKKLRQLGLAGILFLALTCPPFSGESLAVVTGPCSDCHTMHHSQDGGTLSAWGTSGPYEALLTIDCIGCHTGVNTTTTTTPYVFDPDGPTYSLTGTEATTTTLAGGNFFWVVSDQTKGHNVSGICTSDSVLDVPPGFDGGRAAGDGTTPGNGSGWSSGTQITCAGTYGCHGSHDTTSQAGAIRGGHHALSGPAITSPQDSAADYRLLVGIAGYEDSDWEFRPVAAAHNQYKGLDSPEDSETSTISYFCSQCHGTFHDDVTDGSASPWLRHPTNFDMGSTASGSEYRDYGGGGTTPPYEVITPLASSNVSAVKATVAFTDDTMIVTCISCHRAHGSPYYKSMRWDYAGSATGGHCAKCHTTKD